MGKLVTNVHDRAVGIPGGITLQPGESVEIDLSKEDLKLLKDFPYVELSDVDRSARGSDTEATE